MMIRSFVSAAALTIAMLASGAMAQTSINGTEISAEDLPKVQAQCDSLAAEVATSDSTTNTENDGDEATKDADTPAELDQGTTKIDLATLTLDACKTAGFVK
ncbi:hypothetical protein VW23_024830 [Devosia insulae DS-56]|uniref:Secreted protein n=1 Tax=Devosia insulae DS-56 TaxID=1116389 RepID=A0A1E5XLX3_9HYPH|nr:hypothetical protein [Devosia insulae]OEO29600.1 hypothetical protein VW23_024830 [Devosia insulae DS-56]